MVPFFSHLLQSPVGIAIASISLVFRITNGIVKMFSKTMEYKKINIKITLLARSKFISIEKKEYPK